MALLLLGVSIELPTSTRQLRVYDTRIHQKFADDYFLRECSSREAPYAQVLQVCAYSFPAARIEVAPLQHP